MHTAFILRTAYIIRTAYIKLSVHPAIFSICILLANRCSSRSVIRPWCHGVLSMIGQDVFFSCLISSCILSVHPASLSSCILLAPGACLGRSSGLVSMSASSAVCSAFDTARHVTQVRTNGIGLTVLLLCVCGVNDDIVFSKFGRCLRGRLC